MVGSGEIRSDPLPINATSQKPEAENFARLQGQRKGEVMKKSKYSEAQSATAWRCCIIAVNSLNFLHCPIFAEIRKLLIPCVFLEIMQQRQL
jgi:hypothetical protein